MLDESSAVSSDLAERLAVRPPTVTAVVDGLVARGLVERRTVEGDRRRVDHVLTAEGHRVLDAADRAVHERLHEIAGSTGDAAGTPARLRRARRLARGTGGLPARRGGDDEDARPLRPGPSRPPEQGTAFVPVAETARNEAPHGGHRPRPQPLLVAAGPAHHAGPPGHLPHRAGALVRRAGPPGADPQPAEPRHHQLAPSCHTGPAQPLRVVDRRAGAGRRGDRVHLPAVPLRDRLRDRVRPAQHHLRAPDPDVVPLLRPGPVGAAHLAGQLGHPLGADVHDVRAADPGAVLASPSSPSASCCPSTCRWPSWPWPPCRSCTWSGVRMRKSMFPVSWLIQARLADVATIVDENINGVRVVKSFAAEEQQLRAAGRAPPTGCSGPTSRTPTCGPASPRWSRTCPRSGLALVLLVGGYMVIHGTLRRRGHPGLQRLPAHAAGAVHDARDAHHDGPAGGGVGRADLRDPRRAADDRRPPRRGRPGRLRGRRRVRPRRLRLRRRRPSTWCSPTSTCTSRPGETVALVGRTGVGQVDRGPAARPLLRRHRRARSRSTATTCAT